MVNPRPPGQSNTYGNAASQQEILRMGGMQGQYGGPSTGDTYVYMGPDYERKPLKSDRLPKRPAKVSGPSTAALPIDIAVGEFWNFDPQQRQRWGQISQGITGYKSPPSIERQFALWRSMTGYAAMASSSRGIPTSPWDIGAESAEFAAANRRPSGGGGGYSGPVTVTDTQTTVNLSNPSEARAFLDNALGQYLGRAPTAKEYKTFTSALNAAQEESPEVIRSVTTTTPGRATQTRVSDVRREGGMEAGQYATEWARSQEGVAETQAGTTLLRAFLEMF